MHPYPRQVALLRHWGVRIFTGPGESCETFVFGPIVCLRRRGPCCRRRSVLFLLAKLEELASRNTLQRYPVPQARDLPPGPVFPAKTTSDKSARERLPLRDEPKSDADSGA